MRRSELLGDRHCLGGGLDARRGVCPDARGEGSHASRGRPLVERERLLDPAPHQRSVRRALPERRPEVALVGEVGDQLAADGGVVGEFGGLLQYSLESFAVVEDRVRVRERAERAGLARGVRLHLTACSSRLARSWTAPRR